MILLWTIKIPTGEYFNYVPVRNSFNGKYFTKNLDHAAKYYSEKAARYDIRKFEIDLAFPVQVVYNDEWQEAPIETSHENRLGKNHVDNTDY